MTDAYADNCKIKNDGHIGYVKKSINNNKNFSKYNFVQTKNEKPKESELFDEKKTKELINQIEQLNLNKTEKNFLIKAAQRHTVFNYEKIADYYAHSNKEVQELMENSALIIIDFNKAIENGYIQLSEKIKDQYANEYE